MREEMHQNLNQSSVAPGRSKPTDDSRENVRSGLLSALLVLMFGLVGCYSVQSKTEVIGVYELDANGQKIILEILPSDTFAETIVFAPGRVEKRVGKWNWADGWMSFDDLWVPESFAPDYIRQVDSEASGRQPKYTDPGHWVLTAEKRWGTVVLPIFPDSDIKFSMVRR